MTFDLHAAAAAAPKIRSDWAALPDDGTLPFAVGGYPEWSHLRDEEARVETISATPLFAYVTQWEVGETGPRAPQVCAELVASPRDIAELAGLRDIERAMAKKLDDSENPFGGYSGGPLALFAGDGIFLVGIVKEGGLLWGSARAFCSPIVEVLRSGR